MRPRVVFVAVAAIATIALALTHHTTSARFTVAEVTRAVMRVPADARMLAGVHVSRVSVTPIDSRLTRVTFEAGAQVVAEFALDPHARVVDSSDFATRRVPYGNWLAYEPALLAVLALVFVLCTAVTPWRRLRNLDVLATCTFAVPLLLLQHRYVGPSVLSAAPGLVYLLARCAWIALGRAGAPQPAQPLSSRAAPRLAALALAGLAVVYVLVSATSPAPVDVVYAVMEGATKLVHLTLPYGHLPGDVLHGDTYPPLSYLLYTPLAAIAPVNSLWDSVDLPLAATGATAVAVAIGLARSRSLRGGAPVGLAWLAFPTVLMAASSGTTDIAVAGLLLAAVALRRRPVAACGLLAVAGWFKLAPFLLLPLWLAGLRGRPLVRALAVVAAISAAVLGLVIALGGLSALPAMADAIGYQFSRGSEQSFAWALHLTALQPVGEGLVLATVAAAVVAIAREPDAFGPSRLAALCVVILIGLQLSANYWSVLYLAWLAPLLVGSLLRTPVGTSAPAPAGAPSRPHPAALPAT